MRFKSTTNYPTSISYLASSASQTRFVSVRAQKHPPFCAAKCHPSSAIWAPLHCATHGPTSRSHGVGAHKPIKKGLGRKKTAVVHLERNCGKRAFSYIQKRGCPSQRKKKRKIEMKQFQRFFPNGKILPNIYVLEDVHGWFSFRTRVVPKLVGQCPNEG